MEKLQSQLQKTQLQSLQRACFKTKEWSKTSGICRGCKLKVDCGKANARKE
jgi:hypothetical protein